jgi:hypothetical protein
MAIVILRGALVVLMAVLAVGGLFLVLHGPSNPDRSPAFAVGLRQGYDGCAGGDCEILILTVQSLRDGLVKVGDVVVNDQLDCIVFGGKPNILFPVPPTRVAPVELKLGEELRYWVKCNPVKVMVRTSDGVETYRLK